MERPGAGRTTRRNFRGRYASPRMGFLHRKGNANPAHQHTPYPRRGNSRGRRRFGLGYNPLQSGQEQAGNDGHCTEGQEDGGDPLKRMEELAVQIQGSLQKIEELSMLQNSGQNCLEGDGGWHGDGWSSVQQSGYQWGVGYDFFPCTYGCMEMVHPEALPMHEYDCPARPLPCMYERCDWQLSCPEYLVDHVVNQHGELPPLISSSVRLQIDLTLEDFNVGRMVHVFSHLFYVFCFRREEDIACLVMVAANRFSSRGFKTKIRIHGVEGAKPFTKVAPVKSLLDKDVIYESGKYTCSFGKETLTRLAVEDDDSAYAYANVEIRRVFAQ